MASRRSGDVRLRSGDTSITNPKTGEVIRIPNSGGDAEIFFDELGEWVLVFGWRSVPGDITFRPAHEFSNPDGTLAKIARRLTLHLGAQLVGDGGEVYD